MIRYQKKRHTIWLCLLFLLSLGAPSFAADEGTSLTTTGTAFEPSRTLSEEKAAAQAAGAYDRNIFGTQGSGTTGSGNGTSGTLRNGTTGSTQNTVKNRSGAPASSYSNGTSGSTGSPVPNMNTGSTPGASGIFSGETNMDSYSTGVPGTGTGADIQYPETTREFSSGMIPTESLPSEAELFFNTEAPTDPTIANDPERLKAQPVELSMQQFGYDFFSTSQGIAADPLAQVGPDYIIGPGDTLKIDVWGNIEGTYEAIVDRSGQISIPKVGVITLWGQTFTQARETIRAQIAKYFTQFEINVTMGALRSIQVFVIGEVASPGAYQVSSLSTVLTALSEAGGPTKTGSLRDIRLLRNGNLINTIDLYDFFLRGDKSDDVRLQSGDTLFVPIVGPLVGVAGGVRRPAIYELTEGETLKQALEMAGGVLPTAYLQKVQVDRVEAHQTKTVLDVNISNVDAAENNLAMTLKDRDRIQVSPISQDGGYVRLEGYVVRSGTYQLIPGMRLSDLILSYDNLLPEYYPDMALVVRTDPPEYQQKLLTVNLQKALDNDPQHNLLLQEYDTVKLYSRTEMEELPEVVVSGAVLNPGPYRLYENMTVQDLVTIAGNLKRSAFLGEAEITRFFPSGTQTKTERIMVDLGKALAGDSTNNIALQVDDHLFIRSIPDADKKETVKILGEVMFPGTYAIAKGEKLASVIQRAGGYTNKAYLRGGFFTRESLKETQQIQTKKMIAEQENEIYRLSSEIAAGALDNTDVAASQAILDSRQQLLSKLKQVEITGRMIINLQELELLAQSADNIELMDGDTLSIPVNPKTVTVLGQVYTPTSMAYTPGQTIQYYLDRVGGTKDGANTKEIYVVRADGSVISRQQANSGLRWDRANNRWVSGNFYSEELLPGDVVLVPEKVKTSDWLKNTKDITTILYQIAIGAAVVF